MLGDSVRKGTAESARRMGREGDDVDQGSRQQHEAGRTGDGPSYCSQTGTQRRCHAEQEYSLEGPRARNGPVRTTYVAPPSWRG